MAAEDIVTYNGVQMRWDYAEELEATQLLTHYRGHGGLFQRVPLGAEGHMTAYHRGRERCRCCNTVTGRLHSPLCEGEECPRCGLQVMSCDCDFMTDDAVPGA
jgi:hypothetical protein